MYSFIVAQYRTFRSVVNSTTVPFLLAWALTYSALTLALSWSLMWTQVFVRLSMNWIIGLPLGFSFLEERWESQKAESSNQKAITTRRKKHTEEQKAKKHQQQPFSIFSHRRLMVSRREKRACQSFVFSKMAKIGKKTFWQQRHQR